MYGLFPLPLGLELGASGLKNPIHEVTSSEHEGQPVLTLHQLYGY